MKDVVIDQMTLATGDAINAKITRSAPGKYIASAQSYPSRDAISAAGLQLDYAPMLPLLNLGDYNNAAELITKRETSCC